MKFKTTQKFLEEHQHFFLMSFKKDQKDTGFFPFQKLYYTQCVHCLWFFFLFLFSPPPRFCLPRGALCKLKLCVQYSWRSLASSWPTFLYAHFFRASSQLSITGKFIWKIGNCLSVLPSFTSSHSPFVTLQIICSEARALKSLSQLMHKQQKIRHVMPRAVEQKVIS